MIILIKWEINRWSYFGVKRSKYDHLLIEIFLYACALFGASCERGGRNLTEINPSVPAEHEALGQIGSDRRHPSVLFRLPEQVARVLGNGGVVHVEYPDDLPLGNHEIVAQMKIHVFLPPPPFWSVLSG